VAACRRWAERPGAPIGLLGLLRQLMEGLGLSVPGMMRNRWTIGHVAPAAVIPMKTGPSTRTTISVPDRVPPTGGESDDGSRPDPFS
jgi:hypothetical protein